MHGTSSTLPAIASADNHRLLCAQKMSSGKLYLVLQLFTFLQPKWLEGEDVDAESCSRVGDKKIVMQSWEGQNIKKKWMYGSLEMKVDV